MEEFAHQLDKTFHKTITLRIIWSKRCQPKSFFFCILLDFITGVWRAIICSECPWIAMCDKTRSRTGLSFLKRVEVTRSTSGYLEY